MNKEWKVKKVKRYTTSNWPLLTAKVRLKISGKTALRILRLSKKIQSIFQRLKRQERDAGGRAEGFRKSSQVSIWSQLIFLFKRKPIRIKKLKTIIRSLKSLLTSLKISIKS